jgi:Tfp pilus assembly protein PilE
VMLRSGAGITLKELFVVVVLLGVLMGASCRKFI